MRGSCSSRELSIVRYVSDHEDLLLEFDGSNRLTARYLHGPGIDEPLLMDRDPDGDGLFEPEERFSYHADGLGSIVALTNALGQVVERYRYEAFGTPTLLGPGPDGQMDTPDDVLLPQSAFGNPYAFTGREVDPESGLYYYRARYYDPRLGRFLQEDRGSVAEREPLALNRYAYVGSVGKPLPYFKPVNETNAYLYTGNNPITRIDPLGLWYIDVNSPGGLWSGGALGRGTGLSPLVPLPVPLTEKAGKDCPASASIEGDRFDPQLYAFCLELCQDYDEPEFGLCMSQCLNGN